MNEQQTYTEICSRLEYNIGLIENIKQATSPIQRHLFSEALHYIDIDASYFSGDVPIIYIKRLSSFDEEKVKTLHRRIWNQNRVPLLYVITPNELRIYNCFESPAKPGKDESLDSDDQNRLIKYFNITERILKDFEEFSKFQLDSGAFWKSKFGYSFRSEQRVDQKLLKELRDTRTLLHKQLLDYPFIHNLLGRSIFILYLEDREAIRDSYYSRFLKTAKTYCDILADKNATYALFRELEKKFNGDIFPVTQEEVQAVGCSHLKKVKDLFSGTQVQSGQMSLWRPYDFGIIPIELVSAIYEEFLHKEEGRGYTSKTGAYYTPHPLVEFILNEILPWPSNNDCRYDLRIIDPSCGSGIFLVEAFRRLVSRWMFSHKTENIPHKLLSELLTKYIHGIDINSDAIRVAAFSLYLALLDYLKPKTIWEEFQFPYLVYDIDNIESKSNNLYRMDTFPKKEKSKLPFENKDYDLVIGNPPWKREGLPQHISIYCKSKGFAQEMAQAFLWRSRDFTTTGTVALIAKSKILFNIEGPDKHFRQTFFEKNYVLSVVNFSILRKSVGKAGKQLFASAVGPACVFIYQTTPPVNPKSTILYCVPKPKRIDYALPGVIIDPSEVKFLPRKDCKNLSVIWKVAMWGTQRDLELIQKYSNTYTLRYYLDKKKGWHLARGLQQPRSTGSENNKDESIAELLLLPTRTTQRYWIDKNLRKRMESFILTEQSIIKLKEEGVPNYILTQLESLKNKEFIDEESFLKNLQKNLGKAQLTLYYHLLLQHVSKVKQKYFYRKGADKAIYYQPHILLKRSPQKNKLCAAFVDFNCVFKDSLFGIVPNGNELSFDFATKDNILLLKALTAYLNSSFAAYFLFLTASAWGVERDQISEAELLELPGIIFDMEEHQLKILACKVDEIQDLLRHGVFEKDVRVLNIEEQIEDVISTALHLSSHERILVQETIEYSIDFFRRADRSKACNVADDKDMYAYAETFCNTVNSILKFGSLKAWATVYTGQAVLRIVSIHFNRIKKAGAMNLQNTSEELKQSIQKLEQRIQEGYAESIFFRRNVKFYDGDTLHILKPNEKRFWTRSTALCDADEALAEGISGN